MNRRALVATLFLGVLVLVAGCSMLGPGEVDRERLARNASYDWNTSANSTITIEKNAYTAVYQIHNRTTVEVYRFHRFNNERPIDPVGVKFRYPNGTVVGAEALSFEKTRSRTRITLPARDGRLAFRGPKHGKRVRVPTVVEGTHEVILPPDTGVRYFLLGRVSPGGYERTVEDGLVHLRWESVRGDRIVVRYYLIRDLYLFGGIVAISLVVLLAGITRFWLQLRTLRERRESVAWEEGDGGP